VHALTLVHMAFFLRDQDDVATPREPASVLVCIYDLYMAHLDLHRRKKVMKQECSHS
jgi:hypothetical protein